MLILRDILCCRLAIHAAVLLYGSGLLFWPAWRLIRGKNRRGTALCVLFALQLLSYMTVAICSTVIAVEHFYSWFIFLIELNVLFTAAAAVALRLTWGTQRISDFDLQRSREPARASSEPLAAEALT